MKTNRKVLIIYASFGDGHRQVTRALEESFLREGGTDVMTVDLLAEAHPWMNAVTRTMYTRSSQYSPALYGWSYRFTEHLQYDRFLVKWLNSLGSRRLKELIQAEQPDAIIHTFPILPLLELRKKKGWALPAVTVLTDYVLHQRWVHPETDQYYVATDELQTELLAQGIAKERVRVTGIPIRNAFQRSLDADEIVSRYGLAPGRKLVLLMAGAYGVLSDIDDIVRSLLQMDNIQVMLVCGKNEPLLHKMQALFPDEPRLALFGYVDHVEELMKVASCMVTKAGGVTLSEALAIGLPFIVYRPLPGQEQGNARFLAESGFGCIANDVEAIRRQLERILALPPRDEMASAGAEDRSMDAAALIVSDVMELMDRAAHSQPLLLPAKPKRRKALHGNLN
ncbi:MGDG synthase family glycosyltransferase [Gorillibacterium timonense]|uniref:MGDG synthase family glycosyltransferase n=1 Tax=Gorillibacterium timonense TaxID=1689269 RepID=UPI00071E1CB6|nr:glycosyltransferase [Gorillibacterium timonense]